MNRIRRLPTVGLLIQALSALAFAAPARATEVDLIFRGRDAFTQPTQATTPNGDILDLRFQGLMAPYVFFLTPDATENYFIFSTTFSAVAPSAPRVYSGQFTVTLPNYNLAQPSLTLAETYQDAVDAGGVHTLSLLGGPPVTLDLGSLGKVDADLTPTPQTLAVTQGNSGNYTYALADFRLYGQAAVPEAPAAWLLPAGLLLLGLIALRRGVGLPVASTTTRAIVP